LSRKKAQPNHLLTTVFIAVSSILLIRLIGSFAPAERLWGINHGAYIPRLELLYPFLFLLGLIIYLRGRSRPILIRQTGDPDKALKTFYPWLIAFGSVAVFFLFAAEAHFLGDGYQVIAHLSQPHLALKAESYGDMKIHQLLAQLIGDGNRTDVYHSFKYLSILSGLVFVGVLLFYARRFTSTLFAYYGFVAIGFFSASTLLFFGYVETYSLVTAGLFWFFLSALVALREKRRSLTPIIIFLICLFLHRASLVYLPTLAVYTIITFFGESTRTALIKRRRGLLWGLAAAIVIVYAAVLLAGPINMKLMFLPPLAGRFSTDSYFLLAPKHLLDYLNLVVFLLPVAIVILAARRRDSKKSEREPVALLLSTGVVTGALSAFLLEPKLGLARDWDLFSTMMVGAIVAAGYYWIHLHEKNRQFQPATLLVIILCLSIFIPWLVVNNSRAGLFRYAVQMMQLDPKHGRTGLFSLIPILRQSGNVSEAEQIKRYTGTTYPEMNLHRQAETRLLDGDYVRANLIIDLAIEKNPGFFRSYETKARILMKMNRFEQALEYLEIADALNPYSSDNRYYRGQVLMAQADTAAALESLRQALAYDSKNRLPLAELAEYYANLGNFDSSRVYFRAIPAEKTIKSLELNLKLGKLGIRIGDTTRGLDFLDKYQMSGDDSVILDEIDSIKTALKKAGAPRNAEP